MILALGSLLGSGCTSTKDLGIDENQVYPVRIGEKYGFIDATGKVVVQPQYDSVGWYGRYPIGVQKGEKWGYIDIHGNVIFEPQFQLIKPFIDGRAWYRHSLGHGLLAEDGRKLTEAFFHYTPLFINGRAPNVQGASSECVVMDTAGNVLETKFCFHEHDGRLGLYKAGGKFGYATLDDRLVIKPKYVLAEMFSEGIAPVAPDSGLYGYIDTNENWIIPPKFRIARSFQEGVAVVLALNDMWGVIDHSGKFITPPRFKSIQEFRNGIAKASIVNEGGEVWGLISTSGAVLAEPQYKLIGYFSEGVAPVNVGGRFGYIDTTGTLVIEPVFDWTQSFSEGLAPFRSGRSKGFIDKKGRIAIPATYDDVGAFTNGLAMATMGGSIPGYFGRRPGVTLMYIDRNGQVIWKSE